MRVALLLALISLAALADDWQKPDQVVRALALKRSDVVAVVEPGAFVAPLIASRVRSVVNIDATPRSADVVVLYDVLHQIDRPAEFYAKVRRVLRIGGRIVNIDFSSDPPSIPPSKSTVTEAQAVNLFKAAGFRVIQTVGALPYQYVQVFE